MAEAPPIEQQKAPDRNNRTQTPDKPRNHGAGVEKLLKFLTHRDKKNPDGTLQQIAEADTTDEKPKHAGNWYGRRGEKPRRLTRTERKANDPQLNSFDFQLYLQQNPPIEGVFDPKKAEGNAPEHVRQQEALATCRTLIETYIEGDAIGNSADSRKKLKALVETFGANYGFTDLQKTIAKELVDEYYNHRQEGIDLRAKYTDDRDLVRKLTGMEFTDKVKFDIKVGPWGLEITTDNDSTQRLLYGDQEPRTKFCAGGLAFIRDIPPYIILNKGYSDQATLGHERQHIRYALAGKVLARNGIDRVYNGSYPQETTPQIRIENQLRSQRAFALNAAKDEIFAYTFNAKHFPTKLFFGQDGNPYDYLYDTRKRYAQLRDPSYVEAAQKIFIDEYHTIVATAALRLEDLRRAGYSHREAIALLADKPLDTWAETAEALLANKGAAITPIEQIRATITRPIEPATTNEGLPLIDVVIRPDWEKERLAIAAQKKKREIPTDRETTTPESEIDSNISLTLVNKSLYDRTRETANQYLAELGLEQYFTLLDEVTLELGRDQTAQLSEQQLTDAAGRLLTTLEQRIKQLRGSYN